MFRCYEAYVMILSYVLWPTITSFPVCLNTSENRYVLHTSPDRPDVSASDPEQRRSSPFRGASHRHIQHEYDDTFVLEAY